MADFIKVSPPPTQSTIGGLVIPDHDGTFVVTITAYAEGNNNGTPSIWGAINVNDHTVGKPILLLGKTARPNTRCSVHSKHSRGKPTALQQCPETTRRAQPVSK